MRYADSLRRCDPAAEVRALLDLYVQMTPRQLRALTDAYATALIAAGMVAPPDPEHPGASIASLRQTHQAALSALVKEVHTRVWQWSYGEQSRRLLYTIMRQIAEI